MLSHSHGTTESHDTPVVYSAQNTPQTRRERAWLDQMLRHQNPHFEEILITPSMAEMMLACNRANRPITQRHVDHYSRLIRDGLFINSPQPLAFDRTGRLLDGQHRLRAICKTGIPVRLRIFFGEDPAVFQVLDTGRKRTVGDFVGALGVQNATKVAATIATDILINRGYRAKVHVSNSEVLEALNSPEYAHIQDAVHLRVKWERNLGKGSGVNSGASTGLLRILREVELDAVEPFASCIADGLNLSASSDPCYRLRQRFLAGGRIGPIVTAAIVVKAWNAYITGKTIGALGWRDDEPFPTVHAMPKTGSAL